MLQQHKHLCGTGGHPVRHWTDSPRRACRLFARRDRHVAPQARCLCYYVATQMRTAFLGIWRAFAVTFFSLCALVENAITIPFFAPAQRLHARAGWLHRWSRFASRVVGIRVTTRGAMPPSGLLVSNHLSYLDVIVLSSIRPCVFVAKRDVAAWPFFGWLARAAGTIFVDRQHRLSSPAVVDLVRATLASGLVVVLFPEGTSSDGSTVLPFKSALLESAVQLRCPVASASIQYALVDGSVADEVCYWRDMTLVPHLLNLFFKREIRSSCSFSPLRVRTGNRKEIARELREEIMWMRS
jgi:1-acyl-sn-glycerol-3-phosphate acyltransferase